MKRTAAALALAALVTVIGCSPDNNPTAPTDPQEQTPATPGQLAGFWQSTNGGNAIQFEAPNVTLYVQNQLAERYTYTLVTVSGPVYVLRLSNGHTLTATVRSNSMYVDYSTFSGSYERTPRH